MKHLDFSLLTSQRIPNYIDYICNPFLIEITEHYCDKWGEEKIEKKIDN